MRKVLSLVVALVSVVAAAGLAIAQGTTPATPATPAQPSAPATEGKTPGPATEPGKAGKRPAGKVVTGIVKSATADSMVVVGRDKGKEAEWTIALDAATKVRKAGKEAGPADLAAGDRVRVRYVERDGKNVATLVMARVQRGQGGPGAPGAGKPADKQQ